MYGNPSLWFVIAEANGLSAGDALHSRHAAADPEDDPERHDHRGQSQGLQPDARSSAARYRI